MRLSPREIDHLLLSQAGLLAQRRLARGVRLNYPEATALIASVLLELIRDGAMSCAELMAAGRTLLGRNQVMPGVPDLVGEVQVEGTFVDGSKLVTVHRPIEQDDGDLSLALHGSLLPVPELAVFAKALPATNGHGNGNGHGAGNGNGHSKAIAKAAPAVRPGQITVCAAGDIELNQGKATQLVQVTNTGDRPIQVGSHYHFLEANKSLRFDRRLAFRKRLHIASGTSVRFEPSEVKTVALVEIGGAQRVLGGNGLCAGSDDLDAIMRKVMDRGFGHAEQPADLVATAPPNSVNGKGHSDGNGNAAHDDDAGAKEGSPASGSGAAPATMTRERYAAIYGPTTGDRVRLGDTNLVIQVERDLCCETAGYGGEMKFGGGKTIRDGMGQCSGALAADALDLVITNALVVDHTGIFKADVGVKDGLIHGIGRAGNPDCMDAVGPGMIVGSTTEVIAGEGHVLTAGAIDAHVHFICPQLLDEALSSGVTTLIGGGTGPATGTNATTCTPNPQQMRSMLQAMDAFPINVGLTGKGNSSTKEALEAIVAAGAIGLKLHEDWGSTPAAIDACLSLAEEHDIQVNIHTDTLNEACFCEQTVEAFAGRTIHAYHCEGAGGGHAPDIISVCGTSNVLPSSTNPTRPYTVNTIDEALDMLMVCHHLDCTIPEDVAFAESRIRAETIAAEDILHDMGAISIIASDSQAMGRIGETVSRTWQTAHKMKQQRGPLEEDAGSCADNFRARRYVAKYTINPAIAHGVSHVIGSVEVGKLADLVLHKFAFFGAKPEIVIKGGHIACAQMGDANASIPTPQPVVCRPMFTNTRAHDVADTSSSGSIAFMSQLAVERGMPAQYGLSKRVVAVRDCRTVTKASMKLNSATPQLAVDPETYVVTADGKPLSCAPATETPLAQKYFLF